MASRFRPGSSCSVTSSRCQRSFVLTCWFSSRSLEAASFQIWGSKKNVLWSLNQRRERDEERASLRDIWLYRNSLLSPTVCLQPGCLSQGVKCETSLKEDVKQDEMNQSNERNKTALFPNLLSDQQSLAELFPQLTVISTSLSREEKGMSDLSTANWWWCFIHPPPPSDVRKRNLWWLFSVAVFQRWVSVRSELRRDLSPSSAPPSCLHQSSSSSSSLVC